MNEPKQTTFKLPAGFLLGAASAAHQVEGNNTSSDWWHEEQKGRLPKSGQGANHYIKYAEDFELAKQIGLNAMRISIEWSRVEPSPGQWNMEVIEHYRKVLLEMKKQGLTRMVTLHHFTLPQWYANIGGFHVSDNLASFARYCRFIAENLGEEIDLWITINEPEVFTYQSTLKGVWPPFKKSPLAGYHLFKNLAQAHKLSYREIKKILPQAKVSIAKNNVYNEPFRKENIFDKLAVTANNWFSNYWFLNMIEHELDFIGLNYYFYHSLSAGLDGVKQKNLEGPKSDMGWRTFPQGLYYLLTDLTKRYDKPIYITENGIANAHDDMRKDFIRQHLYWVSKAIDEGSDVRGYFYWSLTDTYEWQDGYDPKFGLIEINFETLERRVRPSAEVFKTL